MPSDRRRIEVLLIQLWINDPDGVAAAVYAAGVEATIRRVDIEPALHATLARRSYDLIILDPKTPGLSVDTVHSCMRVHGCKATLVALDQHASLEIAIREALEGRQS
jgi:hypothetical protein